jgi:hypothetical protein
MRMAVGVDVERACLFLRFESERRIEFLCLCEIRNREIETIQRMHAQLARTAVNRLCEMTYLGHRILRILTVTS